MTEKKLRTMLLSIREKKIGSARDAWKKIYSLGSKAVQPLVKLMQVKDQEESRAAQRALWKIIRYTGRPGADTEKKKVITELISLLKTGLLVNVTREIIRMLSEIGGKESVKPVAGLLKNKALREDACMVLQRIPGEESIKALQTGLKNAPEDFKLNIVQSLRQRGIKVKGYPCIKLKPQKQTNIHPITE